MWRAIERRDADVGLCEPFPLPFEQMEIYITRRARASEVDPEGQEHRRSCMEQYWRFQMYNKQWCRKLKTKDCKNLWEAGIADREPGSKYAVVPKGEGISKDSEDIDDELLLWSG